MKQVISTSSGVKVMDVPSPIVQKGHVLVEVAYSFVSTGTELATLASMESRGEGVVSEVVSNPALIGKVLGRVRTGGIREALAGVSEHLSARRQVADRLEALGYSCAGRVAAVGDGVSLLQMGDRVACAGAGKATHSEIVLVPESLTSMVPDSCDMRDAASVAIGAIAMQGTRRVAAQLGERVVVLGLGLVGLMSAQLLKLSGARVFGFDINPERVSRAKELGIDEASSDMEMAVDAVGRLTRHKGADATLITASSKSSEALQMAMDLTRKRGRVVVLGSIGMDIQRDPFLRKEIELLASSSYGPGRYEDRYEEKGLDYPYAYVRWTEKRNMEEYLRLLAGGRIRVGELAEEYPLEAAPEAFDRLVSSTERPVAVVLKHRAEVPLERKTGTRTEVGPRKAVGKPRLAVVGAGKFAQRVHLPSLRRLGAKVELAAIVTRTGVGSVDLARRSGAQYASTSYDEILKDSSIDAVLVATRHDLHVPMALRALAAGKHVFVEKPLAMDDKGLGEVESFYAGDLRDAHLPILQTGFNRRFSPIARRLKSALQGRRTPLVMVYQVNALYLPDTHWLRTEEGGGRNLGEACHFYDLFTFLTGSSVVDVKASAITPVDSVHGMNENFTAVISFEDGSTGALTYTTLGSRGYPKEVLHIYADEAVFVVTDFQELVTYGGGSKPAHITEQSKGHFEELEAFVGAVEHGGDWPIPLWEQVQATGTALTVERQITGGN